MATSTSTWVGSGDVRVTGQGVQTAPAVAALTGGGYVIAWIDGSTGSSQVHAQRFDASGTKVGGELVLSQGPAYGIPALAGLADGGFVATWDSRTDALAPTNYLAQHFDAAGNPVGAAFAANTLPNFDASTSAETTALAGGGFLIDWWQDPGSPTGWGPEVQVYTAAGTRVGGNTPLGWEADGTPYGPGTYIHSAATAATADGGYVAVWSTSTAYQPGVGTTDHVYVERFNASGTPLAPPAEALASASSSLLVGGVETAVLAGSGDVVISTRGVLPDGRSELTAQRFDSAGHALSAAQTIVSTTAVLDSKVTALADGSFVVSWIDSSITSDLKQQQAVYAQRFDSQGAPLGSQLLVATSQAVVTHFTATATPDGGAVFAWDDGRTDIGDIFAERFAASATADHVPPTVVAFSPADEAANVAVGSNITATFSEAIQRGSGSIVLHDAAGHVVASYDAATSTNLTLSGATLTLDPAADLAPGTAYSVDFAPGSVTDLAGNAYAGTTAYNFVTAAAAPPPGNHYVLDSSSGMATAVFGGNRASYTITPTAQGLTVNGPNGTDTLAGIERVQFTDLSVAFDTGGHAGEAYRLYQAAFNRLPDLPGLGYHIHDLDHGLTLQQVASHFIASPEFQSTYGVLDDAHFVTQLYANVLHRAPDSGGFDFYMTHLHDGVPRWDVLAGFSESPENQAQVIGTIQNGMEYVPLSG